MIWPKLYEKTRHELFFKYLMERLHEGGYPGALEAVRIYSMRRVPISVSNNVLLLHVSSYHKVNDRK